MLDAVLVELNVIFIQYLSDKKRGHLIRFCRLYTLFEKLSISTYLIFKLLADSFQLKFKEVRHFEITYVFDFIIVERDFNTG